MENGNAELENFRFGIVFLSSFSPNPQKLSNEKGNKKVFNQHVSSSIFCAVKRKKKCIENRF